MKSDRFAALFLAIVCVGLAWGIFNKQLTPGAASASTNIQLVAGPMMPFVPASETVRAAAAQSVIAQLSAFRHNDYRTAIKYQSTLRRKHFKSIKQFRNMIKIVHPEFAQSKSMYVEDASTDNNAQHVALHVELVGQNDQSVEEVYILVKENGQYRVNEIESGTPAPHRANQKNECIKAKPGATPLHTTDTHVWVS